MMTTLVSTMPSPVLVEGAVGLRPPPVSLGDGVGAVGVGVGLVVEADGVGDGDDWLGVGDGLVLGDGLVFGDGEQDAEGLADAPCLPGVGDGVCVPEPVRPELCPVLVLCAGFDRIEFAACWIWRGRPESAKPPAIATSTTAAMASAGRSHA